ncbi:MAG: YqbH/XkdH family protein [Lachnospiraceae bacterium]
MSLEMLLDHFCDIYHIQEGQKSPGYGLAASPSFSYSLEPDIKGQSCHFGVRSQNISVTQTAPANLMNAEMKLVLPAGTDIRIHDKIVDCMTGLEYTAGQPRNIRNHHIFVQIKKREEQKAL